MAHSHSIGGFSQRDSTVDRFQYGLKRGVLPSIAIGGAALLASNLRYSNHGWAFRGMSPQTVLPAVIAAGGAITGMVASHVVKGSDDARFYTQIGTNAVVNAAGGAALAYAATRNPLVAAGVGVAGALTGALSGAVLGSTLMAR